MKKGVKYLLLAMLTLVFSFSVCGVSTEAANVRTGTLGANNRVKWTYDEDTKTLTMTGEDSEVQAIGDWPSPIYEICSDVEKIILQDFKPIGSVYRLFEDLKALKTIEMNNVDTSEVMDMGWMFAGCSSLQALDLSGFDTSGVVYMDGMFSGCSNLISLDISSFDTSNVVWMSRMFNGCNSLKTLDVTAFETGNVEDMTYMFYGCSSLTSLNMSGFDTSEVTGMSAMFCECSSLTSLDVSRLDTSKVTDMSGMFANCSSLTSLDVSHLDTSKVLDMVGMFFYCNRLTSLDVSSFDTSNVTDMTNMFSDCYSLKGLDLRSFDTSNVTSMSNMFWDCGELTTLDVSGFDTRKLEDIAYMFSGCDKLRYLDMSGWDMENINNGSILFSTSTGVEAFRTPKTIPENKVIYMPINFRTEEGERVSEIDKELCGTTLYRYFVELESDKKQLPEDDTIQLKVIVNGEEQSATDNNVYQWISSDSKVATVSEQGVVTAVSPGTATITCRREYRNEATYTIDVVEKIDIITQPQSKSVMEGESVTFTVNATGRDLQYRWQFKKSPTADWVNSGMPGYATAAITVEATKARNGYQYRCVLTDVYGNTVITSHASLLIKDVITLNATEIKNWTVGRTGTFTPYVNGEKVDRATMTWSSSNPEVATCVQGYLVGKSAGTTTINSTKENGTVATCVVTVKDVITLNATEIKNWTVGRTGTFTPYVNGMKVDRNAMTWSSSNPEVATCVQGYLVGKRAGTTTISCTKVNGTVATCKVTVKAQDVITLNATEIKNWTIGRTGTFTPYVNGEKVDRATMTWSSSNPEVATCVQGYLVGKSAGTTTISCTKANGTVATCKVTVKGQDVITLNATEIKNWTIGRTGTFTPYVNGEKVDRATMTWSSSNPEVATVVQGYLVGKSAGTTTISCTKANGTVATCVVTVKPQDVVTLNTNRLYNWSVGRVGWFTAYVNGEAVNRTTMTWTSENPEIVTCIGGELVGVGVGTTTITCTKANGTVATCTVTVK